MAKILVTKSETNIPFTAFLKEVGAPVDRLLKQARLPTHLSESSGAYLPNHLVHAYRSLAANQVGIEDLGFLVAKRFVNIHGASSELLVALRQSPTLKAAIDQLSLHIQRESVGSRIWMKPQGENKTWLCWHRGIVPGFPVCHQSSLYFFGAMTQIVRQWLGRDWYPQQVLRPAYLVLSARQQQVFRDAQCFPTRGIEGFCMPRSFLHLPPSKAILQPLTGVQPTASDSMPDAAEEDFVGQLRLLLQTYLVDGYPHIELGAAIAGCSVRTLQRRLAGYRLSYSGLIDQARYEFASKALAQSDIPLAELVHDLGYASLATFSRGFRRMAGISPLRFRRQQRVAADAA